MLQIAINLVFDDLLSFFFSNLMREFLLLLKKSNVLSGGRYANTGH